MTYEEYVSENQGRLLAFATTVTANPRLAEDIVQDVLTKALPRWKQIAVLDRPHAYVRRMIVNEYLSWRRRWARVEPRAFIEPEGAAGGHAVIHADRAELITEIAKLRVQIADAEPPTATHLISKEATR